MICVPWRDDDGKWIVDRLATQTDLLPPPPVPFEELEYGGRELPEQTLRLSFHCRMPGWWQKQEQRQCSKKERRCMWHYCMRPAFTAWWRNGKIVKSSSQSRKKSGVFADQKREETKHRADWCAEANNYRCMRCGRGSNFLKDARKMHRTTIFVRKCWKMGKATLWRSRFGQKNR